MVRSSGKDNSASVVILKPFQSFLTLGSYIALVALQRFKALVGCLVDLVLCKSVIGESLEHLTLERGFIRKVYKRIKELHSRRAHRVHVVVDNLRIGGYHRAVEVVSGIGILDLLVGDTRIEYLRDALVYKILNMTVYKLCRIARAFRRDRIDTLFVQVVRASAAQTHRKAKLRKE